MEKEGGGPDLGAAIGLAAVGLLVGLLVGDWLRRNAQRLEKLEGRYWDLQLASNAPAKDLHAAVKEAVTEALRQERQEA